MAEMPDKERAGLYALVGAATFITLGVATLALIFARARGDRQLAYQSEIDEVRSRVMRELDCSATLATGDIFTEADVEMKCPDTPGGEAAALRLIRHRNDGGPTYLTEDLRSDGSGRMGNWLLRATCAKNPGRLVIQYSRETSRDISAKVDWASAKDMFEGSEGASSCQDFFKSRSTEKELADKLSGGFFGLAVSVPAGTKFNAKSFLVPRGKQLVIHNLSIDPQFNQGTVRCYLTTQEASGLLGYLNKYPRGGSILKKLDFPATVRGPAQIMFLAEGNDTDIGSGCHYVGLLETNRP